MNPIRDAWVIDFGIAACAAVFPMALVAGNIRGIPFFWQLIDCSFGLFGVSFFSIFASKQKG
jgi:hypothetical protein